MAGGRGKINEYNQSLTPEQRKKNAKKAGSAKRPNLTRNANIRAIAKMINEAPAGDSLTAALSMLNVDDPTLTNAAGIAVAVFQAAMNGDMKAVEKWESYVGQTDKTNTADGPVQVIIDV